MKSWATRGGVLQTLTITLLAASSSPKIQAQSPQTGDSGYAVAERSAHETRWQRVSWSTNRLGHAEVQTNSFVELATGLNFFDEATTQQWQPSREEWRAYADAIVAQAGRHKAILAMNLNLSGSVDVLTPDGVRLISNPIGLGFYDPVDGKQVLLAELKDCSPQWGAAINEIVFRDCFNGIRGSIRYLYTRAGVHQHVVIEQRIQLPEGFSDRTRLECYTEFAPDTQWPRITTRALRRENDPVLRAQMVEPDFTDSELDFGETAMRAGMAFTLGDPTEARSIRVGKRFEIIGGRPVLTESVEFKQLEPLLARLASVQQPKSGLFAINSSRQIPHANEAAQLPREHFRALDREKEIQLAGNPLSQPAVVIDYELLGSATNKTLNGDTTYYVSGLVNLSGTTTIEGGAIIKYTNLSSAKLLLSGSGSLVCKTGPYRPAIFTSKDDNTAGDAIPGSTGNPTNYNGATYLDGPNGYTTYQYLRLAYAGTAISAYFPQEVRHCQFIRCGTAIAAVDDTDLNLRNVLFSVCGTAVSIGGGNSLVGQHVTADRVNKFFDAPYCTCQLTNSILTAVTNVGASVTLFNCVTNSSGNGIYQTVGAGSFYLVDGSTNRNAGTTNLSPGLLADLQQRTTYPPLVLTNDFTANTNLSRRALRDTDIPDLGYHYDSLDFVVGGRTLTNSTLTLTNGVALGTYGSSSSAGIYIRKGGNLVSVGSPTALNQIVRYNTVQEQATTNWSAASVADCVNIVADGSPAPQGSFQFTGWSLLGGKGDHFRSYASITAPFIFKDCQFGPGAFESLSSVAITNCLFERVSTLFYDEDEAINYFVYNNLFRGGKLELYQGGPGTWQFKDNLFDATSISQSATITHDHNGYLTNQNRLSPNGAHDVILINAGYQIGPLGNFYLPANSPLIDHGSTDAYSAGLYHFTTTTNQVKETNCDSDSGGWACKVS